MLQSTYKPLPTPPPLQQPLAPRKSVWSSVTAKFCQNVEKFSLKIPRHLGKFRIKLTKLTDKMLFQFKNSVFSHFESKISAL
jgi:hypothetical protein